MRIFLHPHRATTPLLAPALATARTARADGVWVRDTAGHPVLALDPQAVAVGVILDVPDAMEAAMDMLWRGPGIALREQPVTASLRREHVKVWSLASIREARMYRYQVPKGVTEDSDGR